jgi:hypothetical protein
LIVFRYCLGMIMSVSMLSIGNGTATPVKVVKLFILSDASRLVAGDGRQGSDETL